MKRLMLAALAMPLLAGCATAVPMVPTKILGQSVAQQSADETACAAATRGHEPRERTYDACMISRGYEMYIVPRGAAPFGFGVLHTGSGVARALEDLQACETETARVDSDAERTRRVRMAVIKSLLVPIYLAPLEFITVARPEFAVRDYTLCMAARGYTVRAWSP